MPSFDLPSVADVRDDSRLTPEQFSAIYASGDVDDDIEQAIEDAAVEVEGRLQGAALPVGFPLSDGALALAYPEHDSTQREALIDGHKALAKRATTLLALEAIYDRAGQLAPAYADRADRYRADAERLLSGVENTPNTGLEGQLRKIASLSSAAQVQQTIAVAASAVSVRRSDRCERGVTEYTASDEACHYAPAWRTIGC